MRTLRDSSACIDWPLFLLHIQSLILHIYMLYAICYVLYLLSLKLSLLGSFVSIVMLLAFLLFLFTPICSAYHLVTRHCFFFSILLGFRICDMTLGEQIIQAALRQAGRQAV